MSEIKKQTQRALQAQRTRSILLKSAYHLFSKYGFDAVKVEDITRHAGVSKGTFYSHFSAKEAVLVDHFSQVDDLYEETYRKMPQGLTTVEKLLCLMDTMCIFCEDVCGVNMLRVVYANQLLTSQPDVNILNRPERKIFGILCEIAGDGKKAGEVPERVDNAVFAKEVMHLAHGIVYDWCVSEGSFDLKEQGHRIFEQLVRFESGA